MWEDYLKCSMHIKSVSVGDPIAPRIKFRSFRIRYLQIKKGGLIAYLM